MNDLQRPPKAAPRMANPRRFIILAGLGLALAVALLFWARPLIRELVVLPLSYLFWAIGIFFKNTPQRFFWAAALLIGGLAAWRSLFRPGRAADDMPPDILDGPEDRPYRGQVSLWRMRVHFLRSSESTYMHYAFEQSVGKLLFDTLVHRFHLSAGDIESRLRENTLDVPPAVRDYALNSLRRIDSIQPGGAANRLRGMLWRLRARWYALFSPDGGINNNPRLASDVARLQGILAYMENDLEVPDDDTGQ